MRNISLLFVMCAILSECAPRSSNSGKAIFGEGIKDEHIASKRSMPIDEQTIRSALEDSRQLPAPLHCNQRLKRYGFGFGDTDTADFSYLDAPLSGVEIVGYGEDTHGTAEFTRLAGDLFIYLVRERGFRSLIIEDAFGASRRMDRFLQGEISELSEVLWDGNWRYYTTEFAELLVRLRDYNRLHPGDPVHIYGPEIQYIDTDADLLEEYLRERGETTDLGPLTEFATIWQDQSPEQLLEYAKIIQEADSLLTVHKRPWRQADSTAFDYARQHLTVMQQYLEAQQQRTWKQKHELRELGMYNNVEWIRAHSPGSKVMYWAHNTHVHAGSVNGGVEATGSRLRRQYGDRYYALGTDFGSGSFLAYPDDAGETGWDLAEQTAPRLDSTTLTACFDAWGTPNYFVNFRAARRDSALIDYVGQRFSTTAGAGAQVRGEAVETESYLIQFDGLIYLKRSSPVHPLQK